MLTEKRNAIREGNDSAPVKRIANHTFAELSTAYLAWAERQRSIRSKKGFVKALVERFGNLPLRHFSTQIVEEYQTERLTSGNKPATVNRHLATLKHMIRKAVDWEMVSDGTLKRVRKAKQLPENNRRLRFLSGEEALSLIDACGKNSKGEAIKDLHLQRIVITALNTGMRKEEILSLEWDKHIDLRHGFILLDKTKNGERRQIPISPMLRDTLSGIVRRVGVPYVFCCKKRTIDKDIKENEWTRIKDIKTAFHAALKRANLGDFRFHDLRHTFASLLVMGGVDLATVKDLLGHKDFKMTLRYAHLAPAHKIAALGVLDGQLNGKGPSNYTKTIQSNEKEVRAIALTP
jgi:integrase